MKGWMGLFYLPAAAAADPRNKTDPNPPEATAATTHIQFGWGGRDISLPTETRVDEEKRRHWWRASICCTRGNKNKLCSRDIRRGLTKV